LSFRRAILSLGTIPLPPDLFVGPSGGNKLNLVKAAGVLGIAPFLRSSLKPFVVFFIMIAVLLRGPSSSSGFYIID
jgi:hypothetical protein